MQEPILEQKKRKGDEEIMSNKKEVPAHLENGLECDKSCTTELIYEDKSLSNEGKAFQVTAVPKKKKIQMYLDIDMLDISDRAAKILAYDLAATFDGTEINMENWAEISPHDRTIIREFLMTFYDAYMNAKDVLTQYWDDVYNGNTSCDCTDVIEANFNWFFKGIKRLKRRKNQINKQSNYFSTEVA